MSDRLTYHSIEALEALSLSELQALWELVPTDRQKAYRAAYDREVRSAGAVGSDAMERAVADELLKRYQGSALVPVGSRWARTPQRVQEAAQANDLPDMEGDATADGRPSKWILIGMGVLVVVFLGVLLLRTVIGREDTPEPEATVEPSPTLTPEVSPTPTPLALEAQDDVITGGDSERTAAYPVNLQVVTAEGTAPRVWVVQRRGVEAAEWNYDPNPDIASFVNGMSVRPVIGIPWSEDNAALFESLDESAVFNLTLNTGAILRYEFAAKTDVLRSDTRIFRQVGPGLVLLLIGEVDGDGLPTRTRTLITAAYPLEQELRRTGEWIPVADTLLDVSGLSLPTPTPTPIPFTGMDVQVVSVTTQPGKLTTVMRLYNGGAYPQTVTPDDIWLALGHAPNPPGPRIPAEGMDTFTVLPGQAADVTLIWAWSGEPYGTLEVTQVIFATINP
ncbi:MAG: hypothetical protein AAFU54_23665 [Chloroflexota bacterium]